MKIYQKIVNGVFKILEIIGMTFLVIMLVVIFYHVIMRYVFNNTPSWSEEVARLCMVYFSYVGFVIGVKEGLHICIEIFLAKLPRKALFVIDILDNFIVITLGGLMFRYGIELITKISRNRLPATGLSAGTLYLMIPIAGAMTVLILVGQTIEKIIKERRGETGGV